jgi:hypothetical protein
VTERIASVKQWLTGADTQSKPTKTQVRMLLCETLSEAEVNRIKKIRSGQRFFC